MFLNHFWFLAALSFINSGIIGGLVLSATNSYKLGLAASIACMTVAAVILWCADQMIKEILMALKKS